MFCWSHRHLLHEHPDDEDEDDGMNDEAGSSSYAVGVGSSPIYRASCFVA